MTGELQAVGPATVEGGAHFWKGSSGRWAGEQMLKATREGRPISPGALRTNDVLRREEWVYLDTQLVSEAAIQLVGVADLIAAGLTRNIPNSMGKTVLQYERLTDMSPADVSLDGVTRTENDRQEFDLAGIPLPITHKDFYLNLRTLTASRSGSGEPLDTMHVRTSGRLVSEQAEKMLFQGGKTFGGLHIYGYTTHPSRNVVAFGTNGAWDQVAKTGENILADIITLISTAQSDRMNGPYAIYVSRNFSTKLDTDFKANSDLTVRNRLLQIEGVRSIRTADQMPASSVVLVQLTSDVVQWVQGEPLQSVQWDIEGGFQINFKAFQIAVPLIRADIQGRSGIVHMS